MKSYRRDWVLYTIARCIGWLEELNGNINDVRYTYALERVRKQPLFRTRTRTITKVVDTEGYVIATIKESI